jgi:DNA-binding XRE family transcriptional regulator
MNQTATAAPAAPNLILDQGDATCAAAVRNSKEASAEWLILWASPDTALSAPIGTSARTAYPRESRRFIFGGTGTSTVGAVMIEPDTDQFRVRALHDRSGLTWEEIADLLGVKRRSVHFWAKGQPISATNARHVNELWQLVVALDLGDPQATRGELLSPDERGHSPIHAFRAHVKREREPATARIPWRGEFRPAAFMPNELVGNRHDAVPTSPPTSRGSIRIPRRRQR